MSQASYRPFWRVRSNPKKLHRSRVHLEQLESRQLLATVTWNNPEGGSWNNASNWSWSPTGAGLPGPDDNVVINDLNAGAAVTISSGNQAINSITATNPVVISGGTLTLAADSSITTLTENGGALDGSGTLTITQNFDWTGGELDGAGTTAIAQGATMSVSGANTLLMRDSPVLANDGTIVWSATGALQATGSGAVFDNSGVFNVESNAPFASVALNNSGTVNVQSGIFSPNGGGATALESGEFDVASGAELQLGGSGDGIGVGDVELNAGTQLLGSGLYELDLGTITVNSDVSVPNLTITGGVLNGPNTLTVINSFNWKGGELDNAGTTAIAQGATMSLTGSKNLLMRNGHVLTNDGTAIWSATGMLQSDIGAVFDNEGVFNVESNATFASVALNNSGTVNVQSGSLAVNAESATQVESGTFQVDSGAVLHFDSIYDGTSVGDVELNAGTQLLGSGLYELDAGSVAVATSESVANLTMTAGTLNGPGTVTVTNAFNYTGGDLDGSDTLVIASTGTMTANAANVSLTNGFTLDNLGTIDWTGSGQVTGLLENAGTVDIAGGTMTLAGGAAGAGGIFDVAQGAVLDLDGGAFTGTLTSSGSGTVALDVGTITIGIGGATFDFPGDMFQWTGGTISGSDGGTLTNEGVINLAGSNPKVLSDDATLDNFGTIYQSGSGNFGLHSDNQEPTILKNEPNGSYVMMSDSGLGNFDGGEIQVENLGTIQKAAGSGMSTILVNGTLNNTGTIESDSGTLVLDPTSLTQLSGGDLSGGTWTASNGATLDLPSGTAVTRSQAALALDGSGSSISGIEGLSSNVGSLSVTEGASFTTTGDFSDAGSLTVGVGSTLTVGGNYTQASSASLTIGVGGATSGNEYGQLAVTGSATLAGSVDASTPAGFTPTVGESFPIVTYASETGGNGLDFTGINSGAVSVLQPMIGLTGITLSTVTSPANLVVQPFSVTANALAGQNLTVTYQVDNKSPNPATGTWTDSVYLSTQQTLNSGSVVLDRVQQSGVAAGGKYTQTVTAPIPGLAPDNYYVIVLADSLGLVAELNRTNTEQASTNPVQVTLPALAPANAISATITSGQSLYYQLTLSAGQDVSISANFAATQGGELYVGYQSIPSSSVNLASSTSPTQTTQQIVIPDTQAGTYDILLTGDTGSGTGAPFTLSAQTLPLQVTSASPSQAGNSGTTTLTIQGSEFTSGTTATLMPHGGGTAIAASQVTFQGSTTLFAQFNLAGAAPGSYDIIVTSGGQHATDPAAFTVTSSAAPGHISYNLSVPSISRPGRIAYLTLTYSNTGGSDALAPLFVVSVASNNATIGLPGQTSFTGSSVQILGIENTGPAGTLPPGYQGTIQIPYESTTLTQGASIQFSLQVLTGDSTAMIWSSLESSLQPSYIPNAAWPAVFANLTADFGSTTEGYLTYLDSEATYLSQLDEYTDDVQRLFGFAINTANDALTTGSLDAVTDASFPVPGAIPLEFDRQFNASISGRDTMGPFGMGWTDNWQISANADSQGSVTIADDGSLLFFAKNSDGTYAPAPGEFGSLTLNAGAYQYVQTDGTILAFNTNGTLNYEQDTNGNRITAGYNSSGNLTSLTATNGSTITIAYNVQGLIGQTTDPAGQTTQYTYDATGQHLLTFTDVFGTTTYTYANGPTAADANALTSLTFADGTGIEWSYDAQGRLATTGRLNGTGPEAETETYAYPAPGEYTITNADGDTNTTFNDDQGNVGETIDALGNITRYAYDANDNLIKAVAPDGTTTTYSYDANGNMLSETDPLGYTISFTYNQFAEPLTFTNQEGYLTSYDYDPSGNLVLQTNPDGTTQQYAYNPQGEVTSSTDPDSQTIGYAYSINGQLTTENLPDGTSNTYTYDGHGNMLTADGPGGDWMFTYSSQNLPTTIVEPNGTLTVEYGVDGNITELKDQTGFTTNYEYDAVGRLAKLTDANGDLVESYTYDAAGNLASETKGNGTVTNFVDDANGDITQITNLAPDGKTVNSQMTYAYSSVGEVTSQTTGSVTTNYAYDADGELTSAVAPGDSIQYAYDPVGNRTSVTENGVVTNYVSNDVNEYTSTTTNGVTTTYDYDPNGNMIAAKTGGQTTSYTFNALNQMTGVSGSPVGTFSYVYDPLGYQISSTVNGQTTNNLIDPFGLGNVAAQFNSSGNLVAHYTYGLGLVSQVSVSGTSYYYDYNLQGSTVGITNAAGMYVNQYSYDPFGQVTTISAGIANPFTFVGQDGVSSDGNGLIDMRARYYDPSVGQFASTDPLGLVGGDSNVRRFGQNEGVSKIDPTGLTDDDPGNLTPLLDAIDSLDQHAFEQLTFDQLLNKAIQGDLNATTVFVKALRELHWQSFIYNGNVYHLQQHQGRFLFWQYKYYLLTGSPLKAPDVPHESATPKPPPVTIVCKPLSESDTGYGFFSGSLGSTTMCRGRRRSGSGSGGGGPGSGGGSGLYSVNEPPHDPNDLIGPSGYGSGGFLVPAGALDFTIEFSNEKTAQVPADNVTVTEQLSQDLNWTSFHFGTIGFGNYVVDVPPGLTSYSTRVDATATQGVYVDIDASLNLTTGLLTVTFTSLDPQTLDTPSNPLVGFLPPDTDPPDGEGYINYTIQPKPGLATGTLLNAQASIVFDTNAPITTPEVINTADATRPTSSVNALPPTTQNPSFTVSWSGSDGAGSGIAFYNVYVSDDGGAFNNFKMNTTATSATFTGQPGHTYSFISIATSNVGLTQPTPTGAQATTQVISPATIQFATSQLTANVTQGTASVVIDRVGNLGASVTVDISSPGAPDVAAFNKTISFGPNVTSQAVNIPFINDGQSGESDESAPLTLSSPGTGATLGPTSSSTLVIHDDNPPPQPPLVTLTKVVDKTNKKHQVTEIFVILSGPVKSLEADSIKTYRLATPGKKNSYTAKNAGVIKLKQAVYTASNNTVAITPKKPFALTKPVQVLVYGTGPTALQDSDGRAIDGDHNGTAGGNAIGIIAKRGVTVDAKVSARVDAGKPHIRAAIIDALLAHGELG